MRRSGFLFFRKPTTSVIMSHFDSVLIISLCSVISYCPAPPPPSPAMASCLSGLGFGLVFAFQCPSFPVSFLLLSLTFFL